MYSYKPFHALNPSSRLWWRSFGRLWEIGMAAPQVIAHRTARMAVAGTAPGARDRAEFQRMGLEKVEAFADSWTSMGFQAYVFGLRTAASVASSWWAAWTSLPLAAVPNKGMGDAHRRFVRVLAGATDMHSYRHAWLKLTDAGLRPVHRRVAANARRLQGKPLR